MDSIIRLGVAAILGTILGLERELKRKPLGLKTCLVISVTSCLLTIVSIESSVRFWHPGLSSNMPEPMRLAAQIVSGVGFLGAGVILRKSNEMISGLTTAAMVWSASGLGIAAGAGFFKEAFVGVLLIIISVEFFPILIRKVGPQTLREKEMSLRIVVDSAGTEQIVKALNTKGIQIDSMSVKSLDDGSHQFSMQIIVNRSFKALDIYKAHFPHVKKSRTLDFSNDIIC